MPGMSASGNMRPTVEEHDAPVDLDAGAVASDLAEPAEEDDADRISHGLVALGSARHTRRRLSMTCRAGSSVPAGAGPSGGRHCPTAWPSTRIIALVGMGFGCVVAGLERVRLEQAGVRLARRDDVALLERRDHLAVLDARPVRRDADHTDGADREQRQRERVVAAVELEAARRAGQQHAPTPTGSRPRPSPPRCSATSRARRSRRSVDTLRPVRIGMS